MNQGRVSSFSVAVTNTGIRDVTLTALVDDVYGDLLDGWQRRSQRKHLRGAVDRHHGRGDTHVQLRCLCCWQRRRA